MRFSSLFTALLLFFQAACDARGCAAYAPPLAWGPWVEVASHLGAIRFRITYTTIGKTLVVAEVRYCQVVGQGEKIVDFQDSIEILTCNAVDNVSVRFKGAPTGSEVQVSVTP